MKKQSFDFVFCFLFSGFVFIIIAALLTHPIIPQNVLTYKYPQQNIPLLKEPQSANPNTIENTFTKFKNLYQPTPFDIAIEEYHFSPAQMHTFRDHIFGSHAHQEKSVSQKRSEPNQQFIKELPFVIEVNGNEIPLFKGSRKSLQIDSAGFIF